MTAGHGLGMPHQAGVPQERSIAGSGNPTKRYKVGLAQERSIAGSAIATKTYSTGAVRIVGRIVDDEFGEPVVVPYDVKVPRSLSTPPTPRSAERLLCYLLPKHRREAILGDLAEEYATDFFSKYGPREARRMYWVRFASEVAATVPAWIWAAILGALAWLWSKLGG